MRHGNFVSPHTARGRPHPHSRWRRARTNYTNANDDAAVQGVLLLVTAPAPAGGKAFRVSNKLKEPDAPRHGRCKNSSCK
jgi:hypothetical protein